MRRKANEGKIHDEVCNLLPSNQGRHHSMPSPEPARLVPFFHITAFLINGTFLHPHSFSIHSISQFLGEYSGKVLSLPKITNRGYTVLFLEV